MKKILIIGGAVFGVILLLLIGASLYVASLIDEDFLVEQIEANLNCRAAVQELDVGLFGAVSSIKLRGVAIGPRDADANNAVPQSERTSEIRRIISADEIELSLRFWPLLSKRLEVESFIIDGLGLNLTLFANGTNNLKPLFTTPRLVNGERNPALDPPPPEEAEEAAGPRTADAPFSAKDLPIAANLERVGVTNGTVTVDLRQDRQTINVSELNLLLTDIDIEPTDLPNHNSADLSFDANISVKNARGVETLLLLVDSSGEIVPFDAQNGQVNTSIVYSLTILENSTLHSFAVLDRLAGALPALAQAGLEMDKLAEKAVLQENVDVVVSYGNGLVTLLNDPRFPTRNYDFALAKDSWIRVTNSTHRFVGKVIASEEESARGIANVDRNVTEALRGRGDPAPIRNRMLNEMLENGRLYLSFTSRGRLNDPDVELLSNLPRLTDLVSGAATDIARERINQELDRTPGARQAQEQLQNLFR